MKELTGELERLSDSRSRSHKWQVGHIAHGQKGRSPGAQTALTKSYHDMVKISQLSAPPFLEYHITAAGLDLPYLSRREGGKSLLGGRYRDLSGTGESLGLCLGALYSDRQSAKWSLQAWYGLEHKKCSRVSNCGSRHGRLTRASCASKRLCGSSFT